MVVIIMVIEVISGAVEWVDERDRRESAAAWSEDMKSWAGLVDGKRMEVGVGGQNRSEREKVEAESKKKVCKVRKQQTRRKTERRKKKDGNGQHGGLYTARPARRGYPLFCISISSLPAWDKKVETKKVNDQRSLLFLISSSVWQPYSIAVQYSKFLAATPIHFALTVVPQRTSFTQILSLAVQDKAQVQVLTTSY